ncbi:MAG: hypothetical protein K2I47_02385, partial [Odoribacter sp.]|nr:hypothetical protein [Odoribacter sp.]
MAIEGPLVDWDDTDAPGERWEPENDPCPVGWRVPTTEEMQTSLSSVKVASKSTQRNGVKGMEFTYMSTKTSIFFPFAGRIDSRGYGRYEELEGYYWFSDKYLFLRGDDNWTEPYPLYMKNFGCSVRCVADENIPTCADVVTDTSVSVCVNDLPYEWGDTTFGIGTESGVYRFQRISTVTGCDSIVNLHLTVHPVPDLHFYGDVCYGKPYNGYGFSLPAIHADTVASKTLQTVWGCDSIRTLHLTVHHPFKTVLYDTVCRGASYNRHGFSLSNVQKDDVHTLPLSSRAGCDSILILHLKVNPVYDTILYDTVCQGDGYYKYGFSLSKGTLGGTFTKSYLSIHGCDSTVTLNLHVWPKYFNSQTKDICERDTFDFRGRKLYKSGVYYDSLKTVHGCDSIFSMTLEVHPVYGFSFSGSVCSGSPYSNYGFSLPAVYRDTIVRDTFKTRWGCDSLRTLFLTVHPVYD